MIQNLNALGQPIGEPLPGWRPAQFPTRTAIEGRYCRVEPIDHKRHAAELFRAYSSDKEERLRTYMSYGPFDSEEELSSWLEANSDLGDQVYYALVDKGTGEALGLASYLRIKPEHGVIEIGGITFSPHLQNTTAGTEALFLMMKQAFNELGYRRCEWKCDALNAASCRAAERLGYKYDGLFRQAVVYRGRNRDTAWYSIIDKDWPSTERAYSKWLDPENFDAKGVQKQKLADLITEQREQ